MGKLRIISSVISDLVTDQRVHRFCTTLHDAGHQVLLVGRKKKNSPDMIPRPYQTHRLELRFEKGPLFYLEYNWRLYQFLKTQTVDLLIANDLDTLPANVLYKGRRRRLMYDSHEFFTEVPELQHRKFKRWIWKLVERWSIRKVDAAITVSDSIAKALEERYHRKFEVVRNLPVSYQLTDYQGHVKYKIADPDKYRIIFYQGSVNVSRGLEEMIEAMAWLPLCKLFIAGDGDILEDLKGRVARLDWRNRIHFLGRIAPEELRYYTVQADLGISIEKKDGLSYSMAVPNKFFDYIQAGVPAVISDLTELEKLNHQIEVAEILPSHDPQQMADTVLRLFADTDKWKRLRENVIRAREIWTWDRESKKLTDVISRWSGRDE